MNVDCRENGVPGHICLSTLNEWKSTRKVKKDIVKKQALIDIFCLFYSQGSESPYDAKLAELYKNNQKDFNKEAKKWTQ